MTRAIVPFSDEILEIWDISESKIVFFLSNKAFCISKYAQNKKLNYCSCHDFENWPLFEPSQLFFLTSKKSEPEKENSHNLIIKWKPLKY